jgi:hypothetical protein
MLLQSSFSYRTENYTSLVHCFHFPSRSFDQAAYIRFVEVAKGHCRKKKEKPNGAEPQINLSVSLQGSRIEAIHTMINVIIKSSDWNVHWQISTVRRNW